MSNAEYQKKYFFNLEVSLNGASYDMKGNFHAQDTTVNRNG